MIKIKSDKIIVGESLFSGYLYIDGDKISSVSADDLPCDEFYDFTGSYVSPGFIETHSHGAGGYAYTYSSVDDVIKACNFHALRHHYASKCLLLGMPQKYTAELMGHSSLDMIEKVYQHTFPSAMEQYAKKLREMNEEFMQHEMQHNK